MALTQISTSMVLQDAGLQRGHMGADAAIPAGVVWPYAGITAPAGWLFCYGQAVSRTTYAAMFANLTLQLTGNTTSGSASVSSASVDITAMGLIGAKVEGAGIPANTTITAATSSTLTLSANATATASAVTLTIMPHGNGDGSTTFNVPDHRGRAPVARDDMGGAAAGRMTSSGSGIDGKKLGNAGGAETHTLTIAQMPSHNHGNAAATFSNATAGAGFYAGAAGAVTTSTGGGGAHNNTQPTIVLNHIIKV